MTGTNETGREPSRAHHSYRSAVLQLLAVAALLAALGAAVAGIVPESRQHLRHAGDGWIAIEVVLELVACASYGLLFRGVFSDGVYRFGYVRGIQIGVGWSAPR